jgi:hypothetical protein
MLNFYNLLVISYDSIWFLVTNHNILNQALNIMSTVLFH